MDNLWFAEIRSILRSPKKLIETAAIILVPILYAGMFIWSLWDPYGHIEKLPVAVVNKDKGAQMEGEHLALGDKLVKNLKEKDTFNFHFVDQKTAEKKLKDNQYYMIIEIPEDFSKNATTLLDKNPQKLQLNYIQNQAMNYISSKIEESAMTKIKSSVAEQVTKTYAEEVFGKVKEMANGYRSAGNGAKSLAKGSGKLKDGAVVLRKGTENLLTGATALNDGIGRVHNGAADLNKGALKLYNGSRTLGEGIAQVDSGAVSLKNHLAQLAASSVTFSNGLSEAKSGADKVANGSKTLASGMNQLASASGQLLDASKQLQTGAGKVADGSAKLSNGLNGVNSQLPALTSGMKELQQQLPKELAAGITSKMDENMETRLTDLQSQIDEMSGSMFEQQKAQAKHLLSLLPAETYQKVSKQILSNYTDEKKREFQDEVKNKLLASLTSGSASSQAALQSQIQQAINPYFKKLNDGQQQLQTGIGELAKGANRLNDGAQQLASGQNAFVKNATIFNEKLQQAASGANSLESGATAVASGLGQLSGGSGQLVNGTKQLANGSSALAEGTGKLAEGSNELTNGTQSLANGSSVLVKGTSQLLNGAAQLQSGSKQLNNGAGSLVSGTGQLNAGADKLSNKLGKAADQAGAINPTDATYNMMSSPVRLNHDTVTKVPNYGTGLAPYFLSLGLFVGGLLLTIIYNVKAPTIMPKNGVTWFLGKFGVMALIGILQSLLADFILLDLLKLHVQSVPLFIFATIMTSLTYMAIIQFLSAAFANPGRYIAVIILILQLTTSAGTFPLELIPKPLQAVHDLMPMTYSLQMFKAVISSGDFSFMWQNADKLSIFFAAFIFLSLLYFVVKFRHLHKMVEKEGAASPMEA